jgi:hypothetical protein
MEEELLRDDSIAENYFSDEIPEEALFMAETIPEPTPTAQTPPTPQVKRLGTTNITTTINTPPQLLAQLTTPIRKKHSTRTIDLSNVPPELSRIAHRLIDNIQQFIQQELTNQPTTTTTTPTHRVSPHRNPLTTPCTPSPNLQAQIPSLLGTSPALLGSYRPSRTTGPRIMIPKTQTRNSPYHRTSK